MKIPERDYTGGNRTGIEEEVGLAAVDFHYKPVGTLRLSLLFDNILKDFTKKKMRDLEYVFHSHP